MIVSQFTLFATSLKHILFINNILEKIMERLKILLHALFKVIFSPNQPYG